MVRQKSAPNFLPERDRCSQTWSLTGTENVNFEEQVLNLIEFSRVHAVELNLNSQSNSKRKRGVIDDEDDHGFPKQIKKSSNYLENLCCENDAALSAACIVKIAITSIDQLGESETLTINLRSRSFRFIELEEEKKQKLETILNKSKFPILLFYDFAEDYYVAQGEIGSDKELSLKFRLSEPLYTDVNLLSAVSFLTKTKNIFISLTLSLEADMNQTLLVTEYVNERCAVDYGLPRSPGFIFDPNYIVKKGKIRDSWQMFWKDVFSDSGSGCFDDIYGKILPKISKLKF